MAEMERGQETHVPNYSAATPIFVSPRTPTAPPKIHKVPLPPRKNTVQSLKQRLSEVFFPDNPFDKLIGQPFLRKLVLVLEYMIPILQWGSEYNLNLLKSDVISGLTIASLSVPQGISYAKLAGLPPIYGLYSSFVPPIIYAILGSSRELAVGATSITSLVMGSMLNESVHYEQDPKLYLQLVFTATFFSGVLQASVGFIRLGFIMDFLSKPTLIGFTSAAAISVSLQQLRGLFGIEHFTKKLGLMPVMVSVFEHRAEWAWQTILMGLCFLALLLLAKHISQKKPKLFWLSVAAPLVSVILSTAISYLCKAQSHGIKIIGELQIGINPSSLHMLYLRGSYFSLALRTGIVIGFLSLAEGIAVGRTFASLRNYRIDGNKEMMAMGIMNMAGSCTSCYVTSGSFSRSAVNYNAGCLVGNLMCENGNLMCENNSLISSIKMQVPDLRFLTCLTPASNVVMSTAVLLTMMLLMQLFHHTPNVILSAIIITAVSGLIQLRDMFRLWDVNKLDFLVCMGAFFGVLFVSVQVGLIIAVGVSIFNVIIAATRPSIVILGKIPGTQSYRNIEHYQEAVRVPSFLILSSESPIYFANSTYLQERILRWLRDEEQRAAEMREAEIKYLILDMAAVTTMDTSGVEALIELHMSLEKRSIQLVLANPAAHAVEKLHQSGAWRLFESGHIYMSVEEAIASFSTPMFMA